MDSFTLDIILPDKKLYNGPATQVIVPAEEGEMGILVNHMPIIVKLRQGSVSVLIDNKAKKIFEIESGYLEMMDNNCVILAHAG